MAFTIVFQIFIVVVVFDATFKVNFGPNHEINLLVALLNYGFLVQLLLFGLS